VFFYCLDKFDFGSYASSIICCPKDQGGLGIEVLDIKNKCLLSKWLFKLLNEEGIWNKMLAQVEARPTDSPFWKGILRGKDEFFCEGVFCYWGWPVNPVLGGCLA
jgi:hypothetical protein